MIGAPWGQVLISKLALVLLMAFLGGLNFFSTRPALTKATTPGPALPRALRPVGAESVLGLAVLCLTGLLTVLPPAAHTADHGHPKPPAGHAHGKKFAPAEGASVRIVSPKEGEVFQGDSIPVSFKLVKGKRGQHVHAYVDGELMGMFSSEQGTLTGIKPGAHVLELRVVTADHETELDAADRVRFIVQ
ncbi:MAG TPA: CopD family protein [Candidatus Acidoferrales bacterium]|nr:CopD family protein [Candidatus Acidoferrales bacterium]